MRSDPADSGGFAGFKLDYQTVFVEEWPAVVGALLLVMVVGGLMLSGMVWGVFGGVKFWGDWFNNLIGLGTFLGVPDDLDNVLWHRMSLMNIMLVLGAFTAALLSRQFQPNRPPRQEYLWAAFGGCLLGAWGWSLLIGLCLLACWYGLVRYNESTEKFTLL